jgi:AcrR family transcriptional regulator
MAHAHVTDDDLLASLTDVFRTYGYEGASLKVISKATGLARASLYHRFPEGKAQMAEAVMARAMEWLDAHALSPLRDESLGAEERIRAMTDELDAFYHSGERSCLLDALSIGERGSPLSRLARSALDYWTGELSELLITVGFSRGEAARRAEDAVIRIEGALVVARVRDDAEPFRRVLRELPAQLLEA